MNGYLDSVFKIAASGMKVESARLRVVSENLANAESTADVPGGDPYRRKLISFRSELDRRSGAELVDIDRISTDRSAFELRYLPHHPAADAKGYVKFPNVNPLVELMDMREAQRSYEANLNVLGTARSLMQRLIDVLR